MKKPTNHKELIYCMNQIPGIQEFMESFPVQMRDIILKRRLKLGWTQTELAERVKQITGHPITQATISRIEGGTPGITADTYNLVLRTLGMKKCIIEFGDIPDIPDQNGNQSTTNIQ